MDWKETYPNTAINVSDYENEIYYPLLRGTPTEISKRWITVIEREDLNGEESLAFINERILARTEVATKKIINDSGFETFVNGYDGDLFGNLEDDLFSDTSRQIGHGTTAKIHELDTAGNFSPVAVKYLISPNAKTLSAAREQGVIQEVERMTRIEEMEAELNVVSKHIRVPHTYFTYKSQKIECYGMEKIDGPNLEAAAGGNIPKGVVESLASHGFDSLDIDSIFTEIDAFFEVMHQYCLHGDIKPANLMIGSNGMLYVIDFGQSVLNHDVPGEAEEQFTNLQADEVKIAKTAFRAFFLKYKEIREQELSK